MKRTCLFFALLALAPLSAFAQEKLPATQLYLFQLDYDNGQPFLTKPVYLTAFNAKGYNNQPYFVSEHELYFTAQMEDEDLQQTDIWSMDFKEGTLTRITQTVESEYSPRLMPGSFYFTAVRVEADAEKTQRLWKFPLDHLDEGEPVFPTIRRVGYYTWADARRVLMFIVNDPPLLILANTREYAWEKVMTNPGRCMQHRPNGSITLVHKETPTKWMIVSLNPDTHEATPIVPCLPGSEDFIVLQDGIILQGNGSKLYYYKPGSSSDWKEIADLREYGISSITRLTTNGKGKLIVVGKK